MLPSSMTLQNICIGLCAALIAYSQAVCSKFEKNKAASQPEEEEQQKWKVFPSIKTKINIETLNELIEWHSYV